MAYSLILTNSEQPQEDAKLAAGPDYVQGIWLKNMNKLQERVADAAARMYWMRECSWVYILGKNCICDQGKDEREWCGKL